MVTGQLYPPAIIINKLIHKLGNTEKTKGRFEVYKEMATAH